MIKYERHPREYTVVGVLSAYEGFFTQQFIDFYGGTLQEIIAIVRNGQHYHFQQEGDKQKLAESFLSRVEKNEVDLESAYVDFESEVTAYEKFLDTNEQDYRPDMILQLYKYYQNLMLYAQAGFDTLDYIAVLSPEKRPIYTDWVTRVRHRAEKIYKDGEHEFIPAYIAWLQKNHLPNYTVDQLLYLAPWELESYFKKDQNLPAPDELSTRKEFMFVRHFPVEQHELLTGDAAKERSEALALFADEMNAYEDVSQIQGRTAYLGTVSGIVRIVNKRSEMDQIQEGEILVSVMTDPSFLPAMQKAAAFVTDEGGTLCHAAIVARELKKPCIIGTKIATSVLKTGDEVEVDATNGIVRLTKN